MTTASVNVGLWRQRQAIFQVVNMIAFDWIWGHPSVIPCVKSFWVNLKLTFQSDGAKNLCTMLHCSSLVVKPCELSSSVSTKELIVYSLLV